MRTPLRREGELSVTIPRRASICNSPNNGQTTRRATPSNKLSSCRSTDWPPSPLFLEESMRHALSLLFVGFAAFGMSAARGADPDKNAELPLEVLRTFKPGKSITQCAAFSPDEKILAAGSRETDTLYLYDVETG